MLEDLLTRPDVQVVFVDTPGIHKPRTLLGERLNDTASEAPSRPIEVPPGGPPLDPGPQPPPTRAATPL